MAKSISWVILTVVALMITPAWAERFSVKAPIANVRSGPGDQHKVLWKLEKFHPIDVIKKQGEWYYFKDYQGDNGWIHHSLLHGVSSVIVVKSKSNVRSGPGTTHDVVFTVEEGVPFEVIGKEKEWIQIRHADGDKGWIHKTLVW